ncbi:MAG TPA: hypothetical protein VFW92_09405, partial [Candidatus Limnocylindrales bacterium]|nr:hypothetical protein [Candidatus Limnocylindrales bacterium]
APIAAGAVIVLPWLARTWLTFGSLGSQATENLLFVRNEDVFAYSVRPSLDRFLAQGPIEILRHMAIGLWSQLSVDLLIAAAPIGALGILAWVFLIRSPAVGRPSALRALLLTGTITFLVDGLLFPVATTWGTFRHAAGPLLAGLLVLACLGLDHLVARVGSWRHWERQNAWLATLLLLLVTVPVAAIEVGVTASTTRRIQAHLDAGEAGLRAAGVREATPVVSDWSIWLAWESQRPALAVPDEPAADVLSLAHRLGAGAVLLLSPGVGDGSSSTDAPGLPNLDGQACFSRQPLPPAAGTEARLYLVPSDGPCAP